jgi:transposase InsO family protein
MSISFACTLFGYDRQVYYRSKKRVVENQQRAKLVLELVKVKRNRMPRLGGKKLYHLLKTELNKLGVGRDKFFDILRANHLLIKPKRQYHITTNSHHRFRKHKNLVEELPVNRPEQLWVSDITYIGDRDDPKYLALVTDSYSKKIVGYDVSDSLSVPGSIRAITMAIKSRKYKAKKLIHHSDRGLQYCSDKYQQVLNKHDIICSMTEKYDPYQNAVAERINGILKQEFILGMKVKDLELMKILIRESVMIYNNERPHLSCDMHTPQYMHGQSEVTIKTYKTKRVEKSNSLLAN